MTRRQLRQYYCNFFYIWIISENIKVTQKHIQSCTTFLNNSTELCEWLERRAQSRAFEPSAAASRTMGARGRQQRCIWELQTLWCLKNLFQTAFKSAVWSGSEREEMPASPRPRRFIFTLEFMGKPYPTGPTHSRHLFWIPAAARCSQSGSVVKKKNTNKN